MSRTALTQDSSLNWIRVYNGYDSLLVARLVIFFAPPYVPLPVLSQPIYIFCSSPEYNTIWKTLVQNPTTCPACINRNWSMPTRSPSMGLRLTISTNLCHTSGEISGPRLSLGACVKLYWVWGSAYYDNTKTLSLLVMCLGLAPISTTVLALCYDLLRLCLRTLAYKRFPPSGILYVAESLHYKHPPIFERP